MSTRGQKLAFALEMIEILEEQIKDAAGARHIGTDGMSIALDDLERKLEHWRKQAIRYRRGRSRTTTVNLENSHD